MSTLSELVGKGGSTPWFKDMKIAPDYIAGRFYPPTVSFQNASAVTMAADVIHYMPFFPMRTHTFDRIAVMNTDTSANGQKVRCGIYADDGDGRPGAIIDDIGEITFGATAIVNALTISQSLTINTIYWLALLFDSTTPVLGGYYSTVRTTNYLSTPILPSYGFDSFQITPGGFHGFVTEAQAYGALPATATPDGIDSSKMPLAFLRG